MARTLSGDPRDEGLDCVCRGPGSGSGWGVLRHSSWGRGGSLMCELELWMTLYSAGPDALVFFQKLPDSGGPE